MDFNNILERRKFDIERLSITVDTLIRLSKTALVKNKTDTTFTIMEEEYKKFLSYDELVEYVTSRNLGDKITISHEDYSVPRAVTFRLSYESTNS